MINQQSVTVISNNMYSNSFPNRDKNLALCLSILSSICLVNDFAYLACLCHLVMIINWDQLPKLPYLKSNTYATLCTMFQAIFYNNMELGILSIIMMAGATVDCTLVEMYYYQITMHIILLLSLVAPSVFTEGLCYVVPLHMAMLIFNWLYEFDDKYEIGKVIDLVYKKFENGQHIRVTESVTVEFHHLSKYLRERYYGMNMVFFMFMFVYQQLGIFYENVLFDNSCIFVVWWFVLMFIKWSHGKTTLTW